MASSVGKLTRMQEMYSDGGPATRARKSNKRPREGEDLLSRVLSGRYDAALAVVAAAEAAAAKSVSGSEESSSSSSYHLPSLTQATPSTKDDLMKLPPRNLIRSVDSLPITVAVSPTMDPSHHPLHQFPSSLSNSKKTKRKMNSKGSHNALTSLSLSASTSSLMSTNEKDKWLEVDRLSDPHFGVHHPQKNDLEAYRREYRRIHGNSVFQTQPPLSLPHPNSSETLSSNSVDSTPRDQLMNGTPTLGSNGVAGAPISMVLHSPNRAPLDENHVKKSSLGTFWGNRLSESTPFYEEEQKKSSQFVLVEESRLSRLLALDSALKREERLLGANCASITLSEGIPPHIPIPATRLAIHSLCDEQYRRVTQSLMKLFEDWQKYSHSRGYHRRHHSLLEISALVKQAPPEHRTMKYQLLTSASKKENLRFERDSMAYEDEFSFLIQLGQSAIRRRKDYDRYYLLASRYGPLSTMMFYQNDTPGRLYHQLVLSCAMKIQIWWRKWWKRFGYLRKCSAIRLQSIYRCYQVYRRYGRALMLHGYGRRNMRLRYWRWWVNFCIEKRTLRRRIGAINAHGSISNRRMMAYIPTGTAEERIALWWRRKCFVTWLMYQQKKKTWRTTQVELAMKERHKNQLRLIWNCLINWKEKFKSTRLRIGKGFGYWYWYQWRRFIGWRKFVAGLHEKARKIQSIVRSFHAKRILLKAKNAQRVLRGFYLIMLAKRYVGVIREIEIQDKFLEWWPGAIYRRSERAIDMEKNRMTRRVKFVQKAQEKAVRDLRKHFNGPHGQKQLRLLAERRIALNIAGTPSTTAPHVSSPEKATTTLPPITNNCSLTNTVDEKPMVTTITSETGGIKSRTTILTANATKSKPFFGWPRELLSATILSITDELLQQCREVARILAVHDFETKYPPPIVCFHPECRGCFVSQELFAAHINNSQIHAAERIFLCSTLQCSVPTSDAAQSRTPSRSRAASAAFSAGGGNLLSDFFPLFTDRSEITYYSSDLNLPRSAPTSCALEWLSYSEFHQFIRQFRGQQILRNHYLHHEGISRVVNTLDLFVSLLDFTNNTPSSTEAHGKKALLLYDLYLSSNASRPCELSALPLEERERVRGIMEGYREKSMSGRYNPSFYHETSLSEFANFGLPVGFLNNQKSLENIEDATITSDHSLVVLKGGKGEAALDWITSLWKGRISEDKFFVYDTSHIFSPSLFSSVLHHAFLSLYAITCNDTLLHQSSAHADYVSMISTDADARRTADLQEFCHLRSRGFTKFGVWYSNRTKHTIQLAEEASKAAMEKVVDYLLSLAIKQEFSFAIRLQSYEEQKTHEMGTLLAEEVTSWVEDQLLDDLIDLFTREIMEGMWNIPHWHKHLHQFAGVTSYIATGRRAKKAIHDLLHGTSHAVAKSVAAFTVANADLDMKMEEIIKREQRRISLTSTMAAIRIQRLWRGIYDRMEARRIFARSWRKQFDKRTANYYYIYIPTGVSQWTRPLLFSRLYPSDRPW